MCKLIDCGGLKNMNYSDRIDKEIYMWLEAVWTKLESGLSVEVGGTGLCVWSS